LATSWALKGEGDEKGQLTLSQEHADLVILACTVQRDFTSPVPYEYIGACAYSQFNQAEIFSFGSFMEES